MVLSRELIRRQADRTAEEWERACKSDPRLKAVRPPNPYNWLTQPDHYREWNSAFDVGCLKHSAQTRGITA